MAQLTVNPGEDPTSADRAKQLQDSLSGMGDLQTKQKDLQTSLDAANQKQATAQAQNNNIDQLNRLYTANFNDQDKAEAAAMGIDVHDLYTQKYVYGKSPGNMNTTGMAGGNWGTLNGDWLAGQTLTSQKNLADAQQATTQAQAGLRQNDVAQKELQFKHDLMQQGFTADDAINNQLSQLLNETGINANTMRQKTGAALANRGMSRSSFENQAIGDVTAQELQQKGEERLQAANLHTGVQQAIEGAQHTLDTNKQNLTDQEAAQYENSLNQKVQDLNKSFQDMFYNNLASNQALDAKQKSQTTQIIGALAQGGAMALFSDKNLKTNIEYCNEELMEFLDSIDPVKYNYIDEEFGAGDQYGVLAQDLEKSTIGKSMVTETPQGKQVDFAKGFAAILASNALIHKRLKDLERKDDELWLNHL